MHIAPSFLCHFLSCYLNIFDLSLSSFFYFSLLFNLILLRFFFLNSLSQNPSSTILCLLFAAKLYRLCLYLGLHLHPRIQPLLHYCDNVHFFSGANIFYGSYEDHHFIDCESTRVQPTSCTQPTGMQLSAMQLRLLQLHHLCTKTHRNIPNDLFFIAFLTLHHATHHSF